MDKNYTRIPENAESKALEREKEQYPVQKISFTLPLSEEAVQDAVEEINPDQESLGFRG